MLIEVKSTKTDEPASGEAKRFSFTTGERLTRLPAIFALIAVAVAAYMRSIFSAEAAHHPELPPEDEAAPMAPRADGLRLAQLSLTRENQTTEQQQGEESEDEDVPMTGLQGYPWPGDFWISDFGDPMIVTPIPFVPSPPVNLPRPLPFVPSNDNLAAYSGSAYAGGSSGDDDFDYDDDDDTNPGGGNPGGGTDPDDDDDEDDDDRPNRAPTTSGPVRLNDVFAGQVVLIGLSQLLFGTSDADGDRLSVTAMSVEGGVATRTEGGWILKTQHGMLGPVTFTYSITDGEALVRQVASLDIVRKHTVLTDNDDTRVATPYDDDIDARDGDDIIDALAGNDAVHGGAGNDHIMGGDGNDILSGGTGNDVLYAGNGDDILYGGEGNDRLFGEAGNDTLFGDAGDDYLDGGTGNDIIHGGDGNDQLIGDSGHDVLLGDAGEDWIEGGDGNDRLAGGADSDTLFGDAGNDVLDGGEGDDVLDGGAGDDILLAGIGDDEIDGGEGHDALDYSEAEAGILVDLTAGESSSAELGYDTFTGIEEVKGGAGDDMFVVGGKASVLSGGKGKDTFVFEVSGSRPQIDEDIVHKILDFVVGDRVRVREYDLDREDKKAQRELFESIYGDDDDDWLDSDVPITVKHERIDDDDWTIILADINNDQNYDIAINIQGILLPLTDHLS